MSQRYQKTSHIRLLMNALCTASDGDNMGLNSPKQLTRPASASTSNSIMILCIYVAPKKEYIRDRTCAHPFTLLWGRRSQILATLSKFVIYNEFIFFFFLIHAG